jgi:hypothetical protein
MMLRLAAIVEGHGEVEAVPILIGRVARDIDETLITQVDPVFRVPSSRLRKEGELERHIGLAARKLQGRGGIFVLMDCDWSPDACPKFAGPSLQDRACRARPDMPIAVVLAYREFEAWFIAAAESLRGQRGLAPDLTSIPDPEAIRGAKKWLSDRMPRTEPYAPTADQAALTRVFDMSSARRTASFDKCYREIVRLLQALRTT